MKSASKGSFTLFELLVVILIISIIYALFVERFAAQKGVGQQSGLLLDELLEGFDFNESLSLRCIENCKKCYIFVDGKRVKEVDSPFETEPKVYDFDIHGLLSQLHFTPVFDENGNPQEVCFAYYRYPNGSASSYIVEYGEEFYLYFAYMRPPQKTKTLNEALELYDPSTWVPTESGEYNF